MKTLHLDEYPFLSSDRLLLMRQMLKRHGWRGIYKMFRPHDARPWSRKILREFISKNGIGLEIGVGEWTIAPVNRTILSDGFDSHGDNPSIAKVFFPADHIPYPNKSFSFLLSEHVLEHLPNVIETLQEWNRVLISGGVLVLFLPRREATFDRKRKITPSQHLLDEEKSWSMNEDTHWEEWKMNVLDQNLAHHYSSLTKEEALKTHSLHRHVFDLPTMEILFSHCGFKTVYQNTSVIDRPDSFVIIGKKIDRPD